MRTYSYTEIELEDFEAPGMPMSILSVGAEFSLIEGWPPEGTDPGEPGELELGQVQVLSALIGEDRLEASPEESRRLQKALRVDMEALGRIEEIVRETL